MSIANPLWGAPRIHGELLKRKQRLNAIGFVWHPHERAWENGFAALKTFHAREGHCRVPKPHVEGTFKLGAWVSKEPKARRQGAERPKVSRSPALFCGS
jgi:hypothetical protein